MANIEKLVNVVSSFLFENKQIPTAEKLLAIVKAQATTLAMVSGGLAYSEEEIQDAAKAIETRHDTHMGLGVLFEADDYKPWLVDRRGFIDFYYWNRYHELLKEKFSMDVVNKLDTITDKILDHLEDPQKEGNWERKGLVVGHVQSGKTANYIGLISKASDAGYKVIIVLGGMLNSLRNQTQARIDSDFAGWCTRPAPYTGPTGVAKHDANSVNPRKPITFTTSIEDFKKAYAQQNMLGLQALSEPVLLVIKKNVSTLRNLREWLSQNNRHNLKDFPLLLIDDEADHASINTNKEDQDPTKINLGIRSLLQLFPRNSYVGYTATPFANIFIDPESEDEMKNGELYRDLFPRDFILSLDPPSNYVGAETLFQEEGSNVNLREIDDNEDTIPTRHKKDWVIPMLPASLKRAIDCFILTKTIRELRGQTGKHHSMMVNVSRFTDVQELLKGKVSEFLKVRQQAIKSYAGLPEKDALRETSVLRELKSVWDAEYADAGFKWGDIQKHLNATASPIVVVSVNNKSVDRLDYDDYPCGRSLIAIGGLGLSRGLTLEGLSVSYFLRNSIMYDTLLQMGRWFGYREGYQDLCRIFMTRQAASWYAHISGAVEELRSEFREMERLGLTPMDFGLKVRSHPAALIVTAKNKMRSAEEFVRQIALDGRFAETSRLINNDQIFEDNKQVFADTVMAADKMKQPEKTKLGYLWQGIPIEILENVVENFKNAPDCLLTQKTPLKEYLAYLKCEKGISTCDMLLRSLPEKGEGEELDFVGYRVFAVKRSLEKGTLNDKRIVFMRRHITSEGDQSAGLSEGTIQSLKKSAPGKDIDKKCRKYRGEHQMPPLVILVLATFIEEGRNPLTVPAYGISFPGNPSSSKHPEKTVTYTINRIAQNNEFVEDMNYDETDEDTE